MQLFDEQTSVCDQATKIPTRYSAVDAGKRDVVDVLEHLSFFSDFLTVIEYSGLSFELREYDSLTLFAPNNDTMRRADTVSLACSSVISAKKFVGAHVICERRRADQFVGRRTWARNWRGFRVLIDGRKRFTFSGHQLGRTDFRAHNGVIHEITNLVDGKSTTPMLSGKQENVGFVPMSLAA